MELSICVPLLGRLQEVMEVLLLVDTTHPFTREMASACFELGLCVALAHLLLTEQLGLGGLVS
jgi:hypothetical protein